MPQKLYRLDIKSYGLPKRSLPSWSDFHTVLSCKFEESSPMTTAGYNPVVRGIPTDANTIYTGLKVTEGQMMQLDQDIPVITFDLQLYVIAQNLWLKNWDELGHFVIRLGGLHIILVMVWKILGKRYGDARLMDLLIESKVFGPNAAKVIMTRKNHKDVLWLIEVRSRMQWAAFLEWAVSNKLISKKETSKLETLVNQAQKR